MADVTDCLSRIPEPMRALDHWVVWRLRVNGNGKPTKIPFVPRTGRVALSTDPATWSSFEHAVAVMDGYDGVGFCFQGSGIVGTDYDHVYDPAAGYVEPWA